MAGRSLSVFVPQITETRGDKNMKMRRCVSLPGTFRDLNSIMKFSTVDESLHSEYGSVSAERGHINFDRITIREYARTVGDNPSCSCGPPVRYADDDSSVPQRLHI